MAKSSNNAAKSAKAPQKNKRLFWILLVCSLSMFGFGYALVPLYNVLCAQLGINGKTDNQASSAVSAIDHTRLVSVQFLAINNANLPWDFYPETKNVVVHPGQNKRITFYAQNNADHPMVIQAVPSVSPGVAAKYLRKTECFCFKRQSLAAHKHIQMPLLFHIDRDLPKNIHTVTLAYTLFDVTHMKDRQNPKAGRIS